MVKVAIVLGLNPLPGIATSNFTKCGPGPNLRYKETTQEGLECASSLYGISPVSAKQGIFLPLINIPVRISLNLINQLFHQAHSVVITDLEILHLILQ